MADNSEPRTRHVPALSFHWLTRYYDFIIKNILHETQLREKIIEIAGIQPGVKILDFGAGTATTCILIQKKFPDVSINAIDTDLKIIETGKPKIGKSGLNIQYDHYPGGILPYQNESFDLVICSLVYHHLSNNDKTIASGEIYRVLKPDGKFVLCDWGKPSGFSMQIASHLIRILDGYENTDENFKGNIPVYIRSGGFKKVNRISGMHSLVGTIEFYYSVK